MGWPVLCKPSSLKKLEHVLTEDVANRLEFPQKSFLFESHKIQPRDSSAQTLSKFGHPVCHNTFYIISIHIFINLQITSRPAHKGSTYDKTPIPTFVPPYQPYSPPPSRFVAPTESAYHAPAPAKSAPAPTSSYKTPSPYHLAPLYNALPIPAQTSTSSDEYRPYHTTTSDPLIIPVPIPYPLYTQGTNFLLPYTIPPHNLHPQLPYTNNLLQVSLNQLLLSHYPAHPVPYLG